MEFLLILQKGALLNLSHVGTLQNEVKSCTLSLEDTHMCAFYVYLCCTGNIHCSQGRQPSHAAVEGEVLHHKPNQKQLDDSTKGLRRSGRRRWFIIYEQD